MSLGVSWGLAGVLLVGCGSTSAPAGNEKSPGADSSPDAGATDVPSGPDGNSSGGTGGSPADSPLAAAGRAGSTNDPELPAAPFLIEGFEELDSLCDRSDCRVGPWMLGLWKMPDDSLQGALASLDPNAPTLPEAWPVRLEPGPGGTYVPSRNDSITLDSYRDRQAYAAVPLMCLTHESQFRFVDENGDGVVDRVVLSGRFFTQGMRGGDLDDHCDEDLEARPLRTSGRVATAGPTLHARGDALRPVLSLDGGFLAAGSAELELEGRFKMAVPLQISNFIYGFRSPIVFEPGSTVTWKVDGAHAFGPAPESDELTEEVADTWTPLTDSGFEDYPDGLSWPGGHGAVIVSGCDAGNPDDPDAVAVPAGNRALLLDGAGSRAGFRLARSLGPSRLSFQTLLEDRGSPVVELASAWSTVERAANDAVICAPVDGAKQRCVVEIEGGGNADLLVTLHNGADDFGSVSSSLCVDELRLDPVVAQP